MFKKDISANSLGNNDFECNLVLIRTCTFFKDTKTAGPQRASERGIRRSEVRFLMKTQNLSLSHAREKRNKIFLYIFTELKTYHFFYSSSKQVKNFKRVSNSLWLNVTKNLYKFQYELCIGGQLKKGNWGKKAGNGGQLDRLATEKDNRCSLAEALCAKTHEEY